MPTVEQALYAMPAMRALLRMEAGLLRTRLHARSGSYGLYLGMHEGTGTCPDSVAHWVSLRRVEENWMGTVRANGEDALPFGDDSFAVVWMSQVLQWESRETDLLGEVTRILAPGGLIVLTGVHPLSAWMPWMSWHMRGSSRRPQWRMPGQVVHLMEPLGIRVRDVLRYGPVWPRAQTANGFAGRQLGGGYFVLASKRQDEVIPLQLGRNLRSSGLRGSLAPNAHRDCA